MIAGTAVRAAQLAVDARADGEPEPSAGSVISQVLTSWDGRWYLEIVRGGYPSNVPANITYEQLEARAAFFPLYPWTARLLDVVLPGGDTFAALFLNFVLGAVSVVLVGILARRLYGVGVAARAMTLYAIFPGSVVLSFAYSEALLIVLAAACLILLLDERWLLAGLAAALATATRPNGVAWSPPASSPASSPSGARATGSRSSPWCWPRSVSCSSSGTSDRPPARAGSGSASSAKRGPRAPASAPLR